MNRQKLTIVKLGGKVIDQPDLLAESLTSFSELEGNKILVHGGGSSATQVAQQLGVTTTMVHGRRITDQAMLDIAVMIYAGKINKLIVSKLQALGINALGLTGADLNIIKAHKRPVSDIDYGYAGDIDEVDINTIQQLLSLNITPVFAPITHDQKGQLLNTNADTIAARIATELSLTREVNLVYCFDKIGVLGDSMNANTLISEITPVTYRQLTSQGIISEGMIPKLDNSFEAISRGVAYVLLCAPAEIRNIHTHYFVGTRLSHTL